ncbi:MAG: universal stress protein [Muribaculaceae bacterium]|nr:universal stress protein [Muribaculaceae bacterium]
MSRFITVAIHTYEKALALRTLLEGEGVEVELNNVNLEVPGFSSGVRVRIKEEDLPLALRIIENRELFGPTSPGAASSHTILVPVDLSENSFKSAALACSIAFKRKASITLLYSYIDPYIAGNVQFTDTLSYEIGETGAREQMVANARKLMEHFAERLRAAMKRGEVPMVKFGHTVMEGVPEDAIIEYAKMTPPRLIVMGTRGAEKKESEMIGSVTAEVLDEGRFTVLTVPEPCDAQTLEKPQRILFFSNLDQNDILAIDTLYRLYGGEEASVTIVHIPKKRRFSDSSADKALRRLSDYCRDNFRHYHFMSVPVRQSDGDSEFAKLQEKHHFDLIVIPNRRRNAFSRLFNPGLAHKILFQTDIPMLVIPV